jgi:5-methyltetrahydropteroyltriglutamate--homocysteine methyltransferase
MKIAGRDILLPTTMVGSWPRPLWLRGGVLRESPHEVDFPDMYQRTLFEDAVRLAVKDQDLAGLDIVTDGNQYFEGETPYDKIQMLLVPLRLHGFRGYGPPGPCRAWSSTSDPSSTTGALGPPDLRPGLGAVQIATDKPFKININAGPATVATWCETSGTATTALRADVADAFNRELRWLADHGADVIQLTEQTFIASGGARVG